MKYKLLMAFALLGVLLVSGCNDNIKLLEFNELSYEDCFLEKGKQYYFNEEGYIIGKNDQVMCIPETSKD